MAIRLALVAYRCEVDGMASDSLDIQVRYFTDANIDVETFLRSEPPHAYRNLRGESVVWPFVGVLAVDEIGVAEDGTEVVGFIASCDKFVKWARSGI
jgi:hypothetical protein